jgi:hypothetical protein
MPSVTRITALTLLFSAGLAAEETAAVGDAATASELSARMLEALGGSRSWTEARTIKVELRGFFAREHRPWTEVFWMDLDSARGRFELRGGDLDRTIAWTRDGGWEESRGRVEVMPEERHDVEMLYWSRQPVVLFHRLAQEAFKARTAPGEDENAFEVVDPASGEILAQLSVDLRGEPTRWAAKIGEHELEHVLGPLESFGSIRFPKWGASVDGIWRYEHLSVELSSLPLGVSLDPPRASGSQDQR